MRQAVEWKSWHGMAPAILEKWVSQRGAYYVSLDSFYSSITFLEPRLCNGSGSRLAVALDLSERPLHGGLQPVQSLKSGKKNWLLSSLRKTLWRNTLTIGLLWQLNPVGDMQAALATTYRNHEKTLTAALHLVYFMAKKNLLCDSFVELKQLLVLQVSGLSS